MKKMPKISVIIPIYNAEKYLKECLNSIINQTYKNVEIICVNDGSTDSSLSIIKEYSSKYENIVVVNKKNSGVIDARIAGLKKATGDYIGWVDSDDFIDSTMYEKMYNALSSNNADFATCNYKFYPQNVTKKKKWFKELNGSVDGLFIMDNIILWNELVKKSLIDKMNTIELMKTFGEGIYSLIIVNAQKVVTINEELYNYRVGHGSLSTNYSNLNWFKKVVDFNKVKMQYVIDEKYSDYWINYFRYEYLYYVLVLMIVSAYNNSKIDYDNCVDILNKNKFFDGTFDEFINEKFSFAKRFFFKFLGTKNFTVMKLISKLYLK